MRKGEAARVEWAPELVRGCALRQTAILEHAARWCAQAAGWFIQPVPSTRRKTRGRLPVSLTPIPSSH